MPDIQRYQPAAASTRQQLVPYMRQDDHGDYVKLVDHQQAVKSLRLSNQALLEQLKRVATELPDVHIYLGMGESEPLKQSFDFAPIQTLVRITK